MSSLTNFKKKDLLFVVLILTVFVLILVVAFIPCIPSLWHERQIYNDLKSFTIKKNTLYLSDRDIRSQIQNIARKNGFHLEFDDIYISYQSKNTTDGLLLPLQIGYTMPLKLALFGVYEWPLVATRVIEVYKGE